MQNKNKSELKSFDDKLERLALKKDYLSMVPLLEAILKKYSDNFGYFFQLGVCHMHLNNTELAVRYFIKSINKEKNFLPSYDFLTDILINQSSEHPTLAKKSIPYLLSALELDSGNKEILYKLASMQLKTRAYYEAIENFLILRSLEPNNVSYTYKLAQSYSTIGKGADAISLINEFIKQNQPYLNLYEQVGFAFNSMKKYKEAIAIYKKILKDPNINSSPEIKMSTYHNILESFRNENDELSYDEYLNYTKEALSLYPNNFSIQKHSLFLNIYLKKEEMCKNEIEFLNLSHPYDREIASLDLYLSSQYESIEISDFCPEPFKLIKKYNIKDFNPDSDKLISSVTKYIEKTEKIKSAPFKTDFGGERTIKNLFDVQENSFPRVFQDIQLILKSYIKDTSDEKPCLFLKDLTQDFTISAWSMTADKNTFHHSHNHCEAWVSGVFYLDIPNDLNHEEGSIHFNKLGNQFPVLVDTESKTFVPERGDIILFPAHLYHLTKSHNKAGKRVCMPFNFIPNDNII